MQRSFTLVLLIVVCFSMSAAPVLAQDTPTPEPVGLRPDAPEYALHGPYWVGTQEFVIEEGRETPLAVHAWYPALNPSGAPEEIIYPAMWKDKGTAPEDSSVDMYGHALLDAPVDRSVAPYPLIVVSHGFGSSAYSYAYLAEHLASHGFVVLAPEHQEQFDMAYSDLAESSLDRPRDVRQVLDFAETLTAVGGALDGLIDMEHVGVAGHSYGGYTALAEAGARYDLAAFNQRCDAARAAGDPNAWLCDPLQPFEDAMAARAGLDPVPEGLWPSMGDSRVDAIVPMAGDSYLFDQAGLAEITIPMMALGGMIDTGTPYEWGALPAYEYISSAQKALVGFENAEHMIFGIDVADFPAVMTTPWAAFFMDPVWDKARAHDLINHFTTAFLLSTLKGDADATAALAPDAVAFPGIAYQAEGF